MATSGTYPHARVAVHAASASSRMDAAHAASELGLEVVDDPPESELTLVLDASGWSLVDPSSRARGVRSDLTEGELGRRLQEALRRGPSRHDRFARALGLPGRPPRVLDATVGLGRDSVLAAAFGCSVIACERSPVVALLLRDGLQRAAALPELAPIVERIDLRVADAREVLANLTEDERPDVIMVDPMFPERRKAARAKHEMQILQRLLGHEAAEAPELLAAALVAARRRVVVKRPAHAPPVEGLRAPDHAIPGRASRYDVYLARS